MYYDYEIYDSGIESTPIYYREGNLEMVCMNFLKMFFNESNNNQWLYDVKEDEVEDFDMSKILENDNQPDDKRQKEKKEKKYLKNIVKKIEQLELLNCPPKDDIKTTLKHLKKLKLIKEDYSGFTDLGKSVQSIGKDPIIGIVLTNAKKYGVLEEVMKVMSFWGNKSLLDMHTGDHEQKQKKVQFCKDLRNYGDIVANLVIFEEYLLENKKHTDKAFVEQWCKQEGYDYKNLKRVEYEYKDIEKLCIIYKLLRKDQKIREIPSKPRDFE